MAFKKKSKTKGLGLTLIWPVIILFGFFFGIKMMSINFYEKMVDQWQTEYREIKLSDVRVLAYILKKYPDLDMKGIRPEVREFINGDKPIEDVLVAFVKKNEYLAEENSENLLNIKKWIEDSKTRYLKELKANENSRKEMLSILDENFFTKYLLDKDDKIRLGIGYDGSEIKYK